MTVAERYGEIAVTIGENGVVELEMQRPPNNYIDTGLVVSLSEAYEAIDADPRCRVIVLTSQGKHFCAGGNFANPEQTRAGGGRSANTTYSEARRLVSAKTPVIAAVNGAAVGGGLGLACTADFRVGSPETRMVANFAQLGTHHGFGLTETLPAIIGRQRTMEVFLTGRRVNGEESYRMGLLDRLVAAGELRAEAHRLAAEIAACAPLAVVAIRATMREGIGERFAAATVREAAEQSKLWQTKDWIEGVNASAQRRTPNFAGH